VVFFQVLVDGWLTKLSAPIVIYGPDEVTRWRVPFDVPVEDYLFGWALVTLTIMLWVRAGRAAEGKAGRRAGTDGAATTPGGTPPSRPR
ncbi:MAG: hypothetical protein QOD63_27, partial [Actinomycetota bacterium]|nr:hypothetical protein [Actinomycetota bacterium]